jgi:hypothetical protein
LDDAFSCPANELPGLCPEPRLQGHSILWLMDWGTNFPFSLGTDVEKVMNGFSTRQAYELWLLRGLHPEQAEWAAGVDSGTPGAVDGPRNDDNDAGPTGDMILG